MSKRVNGYTLDEWVDVARTAIVMHHRFRFGVGRRCGDPVCIVCGDPPKPERRRSRKESAP